MSTTATNQNPPEKGPMLKVGVDAYGHQSSFMLSEWRGKTIVHSPFFHAVAQSLENLPKYQPRSDDVWICNCGKTGTNWVFEILSMLQSGKSEPIKELKEMAMIETHPDIRDLDNLPSPRVLNTHIHPKFLPKAIFDTKVIVTIRNPLSVQLSAYYHVQRLAEEKTGIQSYSGSAKEFIFSRLYERGPQNTENGESFSGTWFDVIPYWWKHFKNHPNVLFLFYEDMKKHHFDNVKKISNFLGKTYSDEFLQQVVEMTDIATMKKTSQKKDVPAHLPGNPDQKHVQMYFRKGQIDEWKDHIQGDDLQKFQNYYAERMSDVPDLVEKIIFE